MKNTEKILVLGPHTDDGEFGCGGTIAKFIEEGKELASEVMAEVAKEGG